MVKKKTPSLGRGLGALLPSSIQAPAGVSTCSLDRIRPAAEQPRLRFEEAALEALSESIRLHGILQPLVVRPDGEGYVLIAGERRWLAARRAGLSAVPVVIRDVPEPTAYELSLVENLQRQDLDAVEEGRAFAHLVEDFGYTHEEVANRVGRSRSAVTNTLRLLELPREILELVSRGFLSPGHARALLALPDDGLRFQVVEEIRSEGLSVRQAEARVAALLERPPAAPARRPPDALQPYFQQVQQEAGRFLELPVSVRSRRQGAEMLIRFKTLGELETLLRRIRSLGS
ncbi:MAG: ParB/RepB/Spo0J family partition protein [Deltaproteobacteria bacterium]|nr:ParB/RepB/Spo0J family partition protein [Deltaproteobacteria bacterium]